MSAHALDADTLNALRDAFGPVWSLLDEPDVTEVMLNPDQTIWVERQGQPKSQSPHTLAPAATNTIFSLLANLERVDCGRNQPELSTVLPKSDARFHGLLPPVVEHPSFSIRKPADRVFTLADFVTQGTITAQQCDVLKDAVSSRKNMLIAGETSSGKTTFANALLDHMKHSDDRIILIEDTRELQCQAPNAVYMQTTRDFTARDALRASLRFNPDRILLGEVRDASAYDLLKAMNTGHEGGFTTLHANSAADALVRLEDLIKEAPNITTVSKPLMASAIHYLLFLRKSKSGRHLEEILELHGVRPDGSYDLRPIDTPSSPPSPDTSRRRIIRC